MKTLMHIAILFMSIGVISCSDINFTPENYKKAIQSGLDTIPEARQIEELLGDSDHFISYHGSRSVGNDWNTKVFFEGRYVLTMQVPVKMGYQFNKVLKVREEPKFYLSEIEEVEYYGPKNESIGVSYRSSGQRDFTAAEWAKVYKAGGDFSVIGVNLKRNQPVKDFEKFVKSVRGNHIKAIEKKTN